jgi:hypothetical protein
MKTCIILLLIFSGIFSYAQEKTKWIENEQTDEYQLVIIDSTIPRIRDMHGRIIPFDVYQQSFAEKVFIAKRYIESDSLVPVWSFFPEIAPTRTESQVLSKGRLRIDSGHEVSKAWNNPFIFFTLVVLLLFFMFLVFTRYEYKKKKDDLEGRKVRVGVLVLVIFAFFAVRLVWYTNFIYGAPIIIFQVFLPVVLYFYGKKLYKT